MNTPPEISRFYGSVDMNVARSLFSLNDQQYDILDAYVDPVNPTDADVANRDHVLRLLVSVEKYSQIVGLTHQNLLNLRSGISLSDGGKRTAWAVRFMQGCLNSEPALDAVVRWLRYYARETDQDFQLRPGEAGFQPGYLAALAQEGGGAYAVGKEPWFSITPGERAQAARLIRTVYHPQMKFFPEGLYLHELPGWVWGATKFGVSQEVLEAIFAHNGPERIMKAGILGALETYEDVTTDGRPFWGGSFFKLPHGPYPLPIKGCLLAILHTMFDRFDQGMLFPDEKGSFVGGIKKIFIQDVLQKGHSPQKALKHALQVLPQDSEQQIHHLWYERVGGTDLEGRLKPVYFDIVSQLRAVQAMAGFVDFNNTAGEENVIHFTDDPPQVIISMEDVEALFRRLRVCTLKSSKNI